MRRIMGLLLVGAVFAAGCNSVATVPAPRSACEGYLTPGEQAVFLSAAEADRDAGFSRSYAMEGAINFCATEPGSVQETCMVCYTSLIERAF